MQTLQKMASKEIPGNIAVFMYPATPEWPQGLPHVAIASNTTPESFDATESNFEGDVISKRTVYTHDVNFKGYVMVYNEK